MIEDKVHPNEGKASRKMINGQEFWTIHYFHKPFISPKDIERGIYTAEEYERLNKAANVYETLDGAWIYTNGKPVDKVDAFYHLSEEHQKRAVAWFNRTHGDECEIPEPMESPAAAITRDALSMILEKLASMESDIAALKGVGKKSGFIEPGEAEESPELEPKRGRKTRGDKVLEQMGVQP